MTAVLPRSPGRHRAPESTDEPRWASPADFRAAWARAGRHAAPEPSGRHAAAAHPAADAFDWLRFAPVAS